MSNPKRKLEIEVDEILYLSSKDKLDMSLDEFIEYSLSMYLNNTDEYSLLFQKACEHYKNYKNTIQKMNKITQNNRQNKYTQQNYDTAMITVNRIHGRLGYIGKNQIRKIANQNNLNHVDLIRYVEKQGIYDVRNFGDSPKIKK